MIKTILIADDSKVFRTLEEAFLTQRGYQVVHAADGAETLRLATERKPDLVLLDVQMPVMDGVQVLSALKAGSETRDIPVLIITTIGRDYDETLLRKAGADDFLAKPISGADLLRKVFQLIGN